MKTIVFTFKDDICSQNGKDATKQAELLNVMTHFGTVEDYERVVATVKAKYEETIQNLLAQLDEIKEKNLTADEFELVKVLRKIKTDIRDLDLAQIKALEEELRKAIEATEHIKMQINDFRDRIVG